MGFLSNVREDQMLNNPGHQKRIALGIVDGIMSYFQNINTSLHGK
jgi:N-acetylmuramoyl-L-alanine amidase